MNLSLVLTIVAAHWFADFHRQTNDMALGKSKWRWPIWRYGVSWLPLTTHVGVYTVWMGVLVSVYPFIVPGPPYLRYMQWLVVNGALHFVTDMWTSRWTSALWFIPLAPRPEKHLQSPDDYPFYAGPIDDAKRHNFFVVIGLDQLIHSTCLLTTAWWWLR